jgi:hypothetical protein
MPLRLQGSSNPEDITIANPWPPSGPRGATACATMPGSGHVSRISTISKHDVLKLVLDQQERRRTAVVLAVTRQPGAVNHSRKHEKRGARVSQV